MDSVIRFGVTLHATDVFGGRDAAALTALIVRFIAEADRLDNHLIDELGCQPAPRTQLTFLKEGRR